MTADAASAEHVVRDCQICETARIAAIINAAAVAYRGVIPNDCWHDPYMSERKLIDEIDAGVAFRGIDDDGRLVAVMGLQHVRDVALIRHAYVLPSHQGHGFGTHLINTLVARADTPVLVGTWAAASWAIAFYQRHGFVPVGPARTAELLRRYWTVPARQIETSVVLALRGAPELAGMQ